MTLASPEPWSADRLDALPLRAPANTNLIPFSRKLPALACLLGKCGFSGERRAAATFLFVDVLGNIAVFVPLGAALAVATFPLHSHGHGQRTRTHCGARRFGARWFGARWWLRVVMTCGLFSLCIEIAQLFIPTRATDIDDVILNTTGALAGAVLVRVAWAIRGLAT